MSRSAESGLFLSWTRFHGRSQDLADHLGIPAHWVTGGEGNAVARYLRATRETRALLRRERPAYVYLMLPPVPALLVVAGTLPRGARIVGDLHTGVFRDPKWRWALRATLAILARRGAAIVTNEALADVCRAAGVRTAVANDVVRRLAPPPDAADRMARLRVALGVDRFLLMPVAYAHDEPMAALFEAARLRPEVRIVLTGRAPEEIRAAAPANVRFSGYLSNEDFAVLCAGADAVLALTTEEETMQRAAYEALGFTTPLVTSPTRVLRDYYGDCVVYATPTGPGIATAIDEVLADEAGWRARLAGLLEERLNGQAAELAAVTALRS